MANVLDSLYNYGYATRDALAIRLGRFAVVVLLVGSSNRALLNAISDRLPDTIVREGCHYKAIMIGRVAIAWKWRKKQSG